MGTELTIDFVYMALIAAGWRIYLTDESNNGTSVYVRISKISRSSDQVVFAGFEAWGDDAIDALLDVAKQAGII